MTVGESLCLPDLLPRLNDGERPLPREDSSRSTLQKSGSGGDAILASVLRHPQGHPADPSPFQSSQAPKAWAASPGLVSPAGLRVSPR